MVRRPERGGWKESSHHDNAGEGSSGAWLEWLFLSYCFVHKLLGRKCQALDWMETVTLA